MKLEKIWPGNLPGYCNIPSGEQWIRLEKLNLFIGPNNSGKSRLLRFLFSAPQNKMQLGVGEAFQEASGKLGNIFDIIKSGSRILDFDCHEFMAIYNGDCKDSGALVGSIDSLLKLLSDASNHNMHVMGGHNSHLFNDIRHHAQARYPGSAMEAFSSLRNQVNALKKHYIPILRGMRPLGDGTDLFYERTVKDYFPLAKESELEIITGFDLYKLLAQFLLGQPSERERVRSYEKILGDEFFGGAEVTLIPQYGKDTVAVKIGDDEQFSIYDLGDGLQQVIIITSAAYLERERSIFFVEEPESCLHPGLLRKLALFLLNHTGHQYIATTHSNHLLDLAESHKDVLIHRVTKKNTSDGNSFNIQECTKDREILADLGVRASSIYLANSTIWIEGITDRLYLKVIMRKYLDSISDGSRKIMLEGFLENYHYAFVEYQGGTLGHWGFDDDDDTTERLNASRLCSDAFLIADGDILSKSQRAKNLAEELKDRFHLLPGKEIENLLPISVVFEAAKRIFERKKSNTTAGLNIDDLSKILTVNLAKSSHGIGYHLDKAFGLKGKGKLERRVFADESGTIKDKVKFCKQAIEVMAEIEWELTSDMVSLCENIYSHVALKNQ
ncbi:AAA family ATPase [Pseudomonas akapageensis]|uniref:AAA family ATPase n=1 Tax=Pseudomonas akapageensis TaxID=2609961 RepID=UPI00140A394D|nr:AAA family ATPase [Pseudomonas akapageensis]